MGKQAKLIQQGGSTASKKVVQHYEHYIGVASKTTNNSVSRIIQGDVRGVLKSLPSSRKFDVIIADPPYNIGKDFGDTSDSKPEAEYVQWVLSWLELCFQLLSQNGLIYVYGYPEILSRIAVHYPIDQQRWLVWHYTNKTTPSSRFWQRSHESILCLWTPDKKRPTLEIDQIREPYTDSFLKNSAGKPRKSMECRFDGGKETLYKAHENGALPRDVIKVSALAGGSGACERWFMCNDCNNEVYPPSQLKNHREHNTFKHPTQKPMDLTKRLILSRINSNSGRVLIPFAGSGSECCVAQMLGVEYLGIEINPLYVDFAKKWLKHVSFNAKNDSKSV